MATDDVVLVAGTDPSVGEQWLVKLFAKLVVSEIGATDSLSAAGVGDRLAALGGDNRSIWVPGRSSNDRGRCELDGISERCLWDVFADVVISESLVTSSPS